METKPVWERALAEILKTQEAVANLDRKFEVLNNDMIPLRADQLHIRHRIERLE